MTRLCLFVRRPHGVHTPEQNYSRTRTLFQKSREIRPLFGRISSRSVKSGLANMAAQPCFSEITLEEWQAAYDAHRKAANRYGNAPLLGVQIPYWNREQRPDFQMIELHYDTAYEFGENNVMLTDLAPVLLESNLVLPLMGACIEVFDASRAEAA